MYLHRYLHTRLSGGVSIHSRPVSVATAGPLYVAETLRHAPLPFAAFLLAAVGAATSLPPRTGGTGRRWCRRGRRATHPRRVRVPFPLSMLRVLELGSVAAGAVATATAAAAVAAS